LKIFIYIVQHIYIFIYVCIYLCNIYNIIIKKIHYYYYYYYCEPQLFDAFFPPRSPERSYCSELKYYYYGHENSVYIYIYTFIYILYKSRCVYMYRRLIYRYTWAGPTVNRQNDIDWFTTITIFIDIYIYTIGEKTFNFGWFTVSTYTILSSGGRAVVADRSYIIKTKRWKKNPINRCTIIIIIP